jgi:hypothetical protein
MSPPSSGSKNKSSSSFHLLLNWNQRKSKCQEELDLFFDPEDGGDMILRNVSWFSTGYAALYPRRQNSSFVNILWYITVLNLRCLTAVVFYLLPWNLKIIINFPRCTGSIILYKNYHNKSCMFFSDVLQHDNSWLTNTTVTPTCEFARSHDCVVDGTELRNGKVCDP